MAENDEVKIDIGKCRRGHLLTPDNTYVHGVKEKRIRCVACTKIIRKERYAAPDCRRKQYNLNYNRNIRSAVIKLLGGKCANPNCRHLNLDGTLGCADERLLQIDHPDGGGNKERRELGNNNYAFYAKILKSMGKGYRLLCAQCNWLHRIEDF